MKTIHKYTIFLQDTQIIQLRQDYEILCVQNQAGVVRLWALVDTSLPMVDAKIHVYGTGFNVSRDNDRYIGTVQTDEGEFVWHIFHETD